MHSISESGPESTKVYIYMDNSSRKHEEVVKFKIGRSSMKKVYECSELEQSVADKFGADYVSLDNSGSNMLFSRSEF
jgi:hypothetical protein